MKVQNTSLFITFPEELNTSHKSMLHICVSVLDVASINRKKKSGLITHRTSIS